MISKELLNAVLGNISEIYNIKIANNTLFYGTEGYINEINVYELVHKCKKWAYKEDEWIIESGLDYANLFGRHSCTDDAPIKVFDGQTEAEAIFKACQWILENKVKG